jgi:hypothetical protein
LSAAHHVWNVTGSSGEEYTVHLFRDGTRRLTCTCAATTTCTHLLAAMYSIDCVMTQSKKSNTTAMRKKARKRPYKKGGKKKPCEVDNVKIKRARKDVCFFFCIFLFYSYAFFYIRKVFIIKHFFTKNCLMKKSCVRRSLRIIQWKNQTSTQVLLKKWYKINHFIIISSSSRFLIHLIIFLIAIGLVSKVSKHACVRPACKNT